MGWLFSERRKKNMEVYTVSSRQKGFRYGDVPIATRTTICRSPNQNQPCRQCTCRAVWITGTPRRERAKTTPSPTLLLAANLLTFLTRRRRRRGLQQPRR